MARTLDADVGEAEAVMQRLAEVGVELDPITDALLTDGLAKFETAYGGLIDAVTSRAAA